MREARAADPDISPDGTRLVCVVQTPEGRHWRRSRRPVECPPSCCWSPVSITHPSRWAPTAPASSPSAGHSRGCRRSSWSIRCPPTGSRAGSPPGTRPQRDSRLVARRPAHLLRFGPRRRTVSSVVRVPGRQATAARGNRLGAGAGAFARRRNARIRAGYTAAGYDPFRFRSPMRNGRSRARNPRRCRRPLLSAAIPPVAGRRYSPLATLLPCFWTPIVEEDGDDLAFGAAHRWR